jgi:putative PIN family toxin of toxin-antitoxin system
LSPAGFQEQAVSEPPVGPAALCRVVLDTNVLVGAAYAPGSASRSVVDACLGGALAAVLSPALKHEYEYILERAVRVPGYAESLRRLLDRAEVVRPPETPRAVPADPEDDKLVAVALAAAAGAIITNDRHLLSLDPYGPLRILRPAAFLRLWSREGGRHGADL